METQEKQIEIATPGKRASHRLGYSSHPRTYLLMLFFTSSDVVEQWKEVGEGLGREEFLQKRGELKKHINAKNQLLIDT